MKTLKKVMSLILAMGMIFSLCAISADAVIGDTLETILSKYTEEEAAYTQTFENEASVAAFGTFTTGTASYDSTNKRMMLTKTGTGDNNFWTNGDLLNAPSTTESKKVYMTFSLEGNTALGDLEVRFASSASNNMALRWFLHFNNAKMDLRDGSANATLTNAFSQTGKNTFKILFDFENSLYYAWLNDATAPFINGRTLNATQLYNLNLRLYGGTSGESLYVDDVKIIPLKEKLFMPSKSANAEYCYSETFDYIDGKTDVTDEAYSYNGVNVLSKTGNEASNAGDMTITTDGKLSINGNGAQNAHCWYFGSTATTAMDNISRDMVISMDVRAEKTQTSPMHKFNLGVGSDANCKLYMYANKSEAKVAGKDESDARSFVQFSSNFVGTEKTVNIVWLIDKETDRVSVWVDKVCMVENLKLQNPITKYSDINAINFSTNDQMYIDNLKVYEVADDEFYNINKVMRKVNSISDICTMNETDGLIESINIADISSSDFTDATVTVTDSKGYYNGTDFVFPLVADTANVTITATQNEISQSKTFESVTIPAAYTFEAINWGVESPKAGSIFDCATIPAKVRNAASDNGRLFIAAALYDAMGETPIMNAVGIQTDTLTENGEVAEGFPIELDLTSLEEIPATSTVKVFLWDNAMVPFGTQYEKTYTN